MSYDNSVTGQDYLDNLREREEDFDPEKEILMEEQVDFDIDCLFDNQDLA
jgi:hypothetical protein